MLGKAYTEKKGGSNEYNNGYTEGKPRNLPVELFVLGAGNHPLATASDKELMDNATSIVTEDDRETLTVDHPLNILNWIAKRPASVPRRVAEGPFNDTFAPLVHHALTKALRVKIRRIQPVEAVGRIHRLNVEPLDRPNLPVMIMVPFEYELDAAWNLYYHAVRHLMNYMVEGDTRLVQQREQWITFDFWGGRRRSPYIATIHRGEATRRFRGAMREMIQLSPGILSVAELTYILSTLVGLINSLHMMQALAN